MKFTNYSRAQREKVVKSVVVAALISGFISGLVSGCTATHSPETSEPMRVLTHDSFVSKHGIGPSVEKAYQEQCAAQGQRPLKWEVAGDAGQIIDRLKLSQARGSTELTGVIGLDSLQSDRANAFIDQEHTTPYDRSMVSWMVDQELLKKQNLAPPQTWDDLLHPRFAKKVLMQDPRSSTIGFAWLKLVRLLKKDQAQDYFKKFQKSVLTWTSGWDQSYGMFLKEKAPIVWSYVSSEAYHRKESPGQTRYRALILEDTSLAQVEFAAPVKGVPSSSAWSCLIKVLLSESIQKEIPVRNWMWPISQATPLPEFFLNLSVPQKILDESWSSEKVQKELDQWRNSFQ
jgi:thiamine transport system substrate-binding protein